MDQNWAGNPFASVFCKHRPDFNEMNDKVRQIVLVMFSSGSTIKQVKYLSQSSCRPLSDPSVPSQRFYIDLFEIHPIKIVASYLSRDSYANYTSTHEMLRYEIRAVYIAKGSPLLPPTSGSIFDDLASSSLDDVFFNTSRDVINLLGLTMG